MCDLVKENGEFYNLKEFNELYQLNVCALEYYGVIKFLNSYFTQLKIIRMATNVPLDDSPDYVRVLNYITMH